MTADVDVVVTDGFTGNVVLKTLEGGMRTLVVGHLRGLRHEPRDAGRQRGARCRPSCRSTARSTPTTPAGAMLLGVDGLCLISHGSSSATAIVNAVRVAKELHDAEIVERLRAAVS